MESDFDLPLPGPLPTQIPAHLRPLLEARDAAWSACLEKAKAQIDTFRTELEQLKAQLDWFKRQLFGQKSERRPLLVDPAHQLGLDLRDGSPELSPEEVPTEEITYTRSKLKKRPENCVTDSGLRFDDSVPVQTIEVKAPELEGPDADQYEIIDYEVTHRLAQRPGSFVVLAYRQPVVKHKPTATLATHSAPTGVWEGSIADVSVLAGLLVEKFAYHLPLYRQHRRLEDAGIHLSRSTLLHWTQRAIDLLKPIYEAQQAHILEGQVVACDETPIKAGPNKAKGKMKQAWFWPLYGEDDEICFTFSPTRARNHLDRILEGFSGTLLSDGYPAYARYAEINQKVTHAQCWSHTRRQFLKAEKIEPEATRQALAFIQKLYRVEAEIRERDLDGQKKLDYRTEHAKPVVEAFFAWCDEQIRRQDLLPRNPLAQALNYAWERQAALKVYLTDPDVPIDTNHLERALRAIPMGRKNWLFSWTEAGAAQVGIIQSLVTTCRLQGIDPYTYLVDVLQRVSSHPASRVEELTPRRWRELFADNPMRSDLDTLGQ